MEKLEKLARKIAAHKMGLIKDTNGELLPNDLWQQCISDAEWYLEELNKEIALEERRQLEEEYMR